MRFFVLILLLSISSLSLLSYSPDSTQQGNPGDFSPEKRVQDLIDLAQEQKNTHLTQAIQTISQASVIAKEHDCYALWNLTLYYHSLYLFMLGENQRSKEMILQILPFYQGDVYPMKKAILYNRLGKIAGLQAQYEESLRYHEEALRVFLELNKSISIGITYIYLADLYKDMGRYVEALNSCYLGLESFQSATSLDFVSREEGIAMALSTIGDIYLIIEDYATADSFFVASLKNQEQIRNKQFIIKPLNNLGVIAYELGNYQDAKRYFEDARRFIDDLGNFPYYPETLLYLSKLEELEGDVEESLSLVEKAKQQSIAHKSIRFEICADLRKGELLLKQGQEGKAAQLFLRVDTWATENKDFALRAQSASALAALAKSRGDYKSAYTYQVLLKAAEDSTKNVKILNEITARTLMFQYEQKQTQRELEQEITEAKLQTKIERQQIVKNALVLGLGAVFFFTLLLMRSNYLRRLTLRNLQEKNHALRITEQRLESKNKEMEKYIESNMQLENFAYIASHDLRAPLNTVVSFSKLLKKSLATTLGNREEKFLEFIISGASQMQALIQALLRYSRVDTRDLQTESIAVSTIIELVKNDLRQDLMDKKAKVIVGEMPAKLIADPVKLRQLFQNLMSNSLKFTPPHKTPQIEINSQDAHTHWQFSISDNGMGIEAEFQNKIFMIFKRLHTHDEIEGTGIGLALCKKIVEQHEGKIWVDSSKDQGSTFCFTLAKAL